MKSKAIFLTAALSLAPLAASAADASPTHLPVPPRPGVTVAPPFSAAVWAGNTLYISGMTDGGAALGGTPGDAAKRVLDSLKRAVEAGGLTMDDLTWVQVFSSDLADYQAFNDLYRTYFKGPLPARAYLGVDHLLGNARFEIMGIAARRPK
ncbi:MAG: RidA family protein [Alphaproteobacteria bacterium]|nr:RidA family protein [Alphaproteobacteria bacterium]MBU1514395.1 RidA family protein [Alphaproteobacteria bacterium]MBU2096039.1 RidA family protein [Alphaproteobacteria bacterium]MBU2150081.1 RidA family protein [Alphaproteobacteria bacterium]MBU2308594.1 RidA family protein [Alphaproteobacteria bacterium]